VSDYLTHFIVNAGMVEFSTSDGQCWRMRQPTPEEAAGGDSAARLAREAVLSDPRLASLAADAEALQREAAVRASAARAVYLVPLLLQTGSGEQAYNVHNPASMAEFEALDGDLIAEFCGVLWGPIAQAIIEAKKKSRSGLSVKSKSASS